MSSKKPLEKAGKRKEMDPPTSQGDDSGEETEAENVSIEVEKNTNMGRRSILWKLAIAVLFFAILLFIPYAPPNKDGLSIDIPSKTDNTDGSSVDKPSDMDNRDGPSVDVPFDTDNKDNSSFDAPGKTDNGDDFSSENSSSTDNKESVPERRIIIVGMTGTGKSATGNTILGNETFPSMPVGESVTGHISLGIAERFGKKLVVIDTPGLFDTNKRKDNTGILREISKCYAVTSPGIHAIILTIPIGRITDRIDETVKIFLSYFGNDATSVMLVVFTFKIQLELEEMLLKTYINSIPKESPLLKVLNQVDGRYLAFGYKGKKKDREEEVKQLLDMIDENVANLPNGLFSNDMFQKIEQYLLDEEKAIIDNEQLNKKDNKETNRDKIRRSIVDNIIAFFDPYYQYFSKLYTSMLSQFY